MLQIVMNAGKDNEKIMDLVDTPEIVLVQFCDMTLKHRDLRNQDIRNTVQQIINALKVKAEKESTEPVVFNRYDLKSYITDIEDLLKQFA